MLLLLARKKRSQGSSSNITNLAAANHDNNTDSIDDQNDDVVLAGVPNHSFPYLQVSQGDIIDDDLDDDEVNEHNDPLGVEYNATAYDG